MEYTSKDFIKEDDDEMSVYHRLQSFADANPDYNAKFLDSIEIFLSGNGEISGSQYNVLVKMYNNLP